MSILWCGVRWVELYQVNLKWLNRKWEHANNEGNHFNPRHSILKIDLAMYSSHGGWWGSARKGNKSLLHNILTLTHFGVINQAPVHSVPPPPLICYCKCCPYNRRLSISPAFYWLILCSMEGASITITIFYEYIFMNILASSLPPPPTTHIHIHIWWSVVFSQLIGGQINQRPYLQSICWEGAVGSRRLSNMLDNNRKWRDSTQTLEASHLAVRYVLLIQMSVSRGVCFRGALQRTFCGSAGGKWRLVQTDSISCQLIKWNCTPCVWKATPNLQFN